MYFRSLTLGTPLTVEEITPTKEEEEVPQEDESNAFYDGEVGCSE